MDSGLAVVTTAIAPSDSITLVGMGVPTSDIFVFIDGLPQGDGDNPGQVDAIVGAFREGDAPEAVAMAVKQLAERLSPGGRLLVSATSTQVARLIRGLGSQKLLRVEGERRKRGNAVLVIS